MVPFVCLLLLLVVSAMQASPVSVATHRIAARDNENIKITTGEPSRDRTIFVVVSLVCMMGIAFLLGARARQLRRSIRMRRNLMSILFLFMCIVFILYIVLSAAMVTGQGLSTYNQCNIGTLVCIISYILIKGTVYAFMVERVRIVRAPFVKRSKDKIYLSCMAMAGILYSAISINAFVLRNTELRTSDGRCHGGLPPNASFPTIAVNLFTNLVLTGCFFYLLRPVVQPRRTEPISGSAELRTARKTYLDPCPHETAVQRNIRTLLWKSIIGSFLIELTMVANMLQFALTKGEELGMICFAVCMVDVFWDCLVVHWLTFGSSAQAERSLARSIYASTTSTLRQQGSGPAQVFEQSETKGVDLVKAPESVHVQSEDYIHITRTLSNADTRTTIHSQQEESVRELSTELILQSHAR